MALCTVTLHSCCSSTPDINIHVYIYRYIYTHHYIRTKLKPSVTAISNTDIVKVDHFQAVLTFLSTSSLPSYSFWGYMQSSTQLSLGVLQSSQIRTDFVNSLLCRTLLSVFLLSGRFEYEDGLFAFISFGNTRIGEKRKKNCLPEQTKVENTSAAICDSTRVTVRNKVWLVERNSWQLPSFTFNVIRADIPLRGLPCRVALSVPVQSQAESSLLVGAWADATVLADKPTRDFWETPAHWSMAVVWISLH